MRNYNMSKTDNCNRVTTCDLLNSFKQCGETDKIEEILSNLPILLTFPEIGDSLLELMKEELKNALKCSNKCEIDRLIALILFLTYVEYVLNLIDTCDPLAKILVKNAEVPDIDACGGRIRLWKLIAPHPHIVKKCIKSTDSKKHEVILSKLLQDSKERDIIYEMIDCHYLVEILSDRQDRQNSQDCQDSKDIIKIIYSYVDISSLLEIIDTEIDLFLCFGSDIKLKNDPNELVRKYILDYHEQDCDTLPDICIDMSVIILYIGMLVSNWLGVDLLKHMAKNNLLNSKVMDRIKN
jgi:hypothetical protein